MKATCQQTTDEIKALTAAFKVQIAKTKELAPPLVPSLEDLSALLEPKVKESIREEVMGMMSTLRNEIIHIVQTQAAPLNESFNEKLNKLSRLPEIMMFLHNGEQQLNAGKASSSSTVSRPP